MTQAQHQLFLEETESISGNSQNESDSIEAKPVLGLNLKDYFLKRHLVDQQPVEPLPPIENILETTQNHEEWVRGQEDFKIRHEIIQGGINDFESLDLNENSAFNVQLQKELEYFKEGVGNMTFDVKQWE